MGLKLLVRRENRKLAFAYPLLLQQFLQLGSDSVTDLASCRLAANIGSANTGLDHIADSRLDGLGVIHAVQGVLHHHGNGENGGDGVDDALACNVGGRTCLRVSI